MLTNVNILTIIFLGVNILTSFEKRYLSPGASGCPCLRSPGESVAKSNKEVINVYL
jgi:hypothetical protein